MLMIRTGMREIIELIRKHPKIRRILRCESPYFHHWFSQHNVTSGQVTAVSNAVLETDILIFVVGVWGLITPLTNNIFS